MKEDGEVKDQWAKKKSQGRYKTVLNEQNISNQFASADDYIENSSDNLNEDYRITFNRELPNSLNGSQNIMTKIPKYKGYTNNIPMSNSYY